VQELAKPQTAINKSNASHFTASMQTEAWWLVNTPILRESAAREHFRVRGCTLQLLRENLVSVRGYGLRTYKSRQGRNAATVV